MRSLLFVALFGLVALSQAAPSPGVWDLFKTVHGKSYSSEAEEALRMKVFFEKVAEIEQHNARYEAGEESFKMGINQFSDMLTSEVSSTMNGFKPSDEIEATATFAKLDPEVAATLPETVDWRTANIVTYVKNEGTNCTSDYAFSVTGSLEGQHAKKTGYLISLSEQQLIDCSGGKNRGCDGGFQTISYDYIKAAGGLMSEKDYPYTATKSDTCEFIPSELVATMTGYVVVNPRGDEEALKQAVATVGPVSAWIDASQSSFLSYGSGVYYDASCRSTIGNRMVLVIGYGTQYSTDYWLVKNSWGVGWGEAGYMKLIRNHNNACGIASIVSHPTV